MGDHYYNLGKDSWSTAYSYYAAYGRAALTYTQRKRVLDIINFAETNRRLLILDGIYVLFSFFCLFMIPSFSIYKGQTVLGIISLFLEVCLLFYGINTHRSNRFASLYTVTVLITIIWMLFVSIRIGF